MGVHIKNTFIHIEPMLQVWKFTDKSTDIIIGLPKNKILWKVIRTIV